MQAGIQALRQCQQQVQRLALFSSNEDAEDITSAGEAMAPHMFIIGVASGHCQQQCCIPQSSAQVRLISLWFTDACKLPCRFNRPHRTGSALSAQHVAK